MRESLSKQVRQYKGGKEKNAKISCASPARLGLAGIH